MHTFIGLIVFLCLLSRPLHAADDRVLFDFEAATTVQGWANLELPAAKAKEPPVKIEHSAQNATSGQHSLKLTFAAAFIRHYGLAERGGTLAPGSL